MNETTESIIEEVAEEATEAITEETDTPSADEVSALKAELDDLRSQLEMSRAMYDRLHSECIEFASLYPGVPLSSIPDSIWESTKTGIPLAAAFALAEKKEQAAKAKAINVNSQNNERSSGALSSSKTEDFFTPAEVRAMSVAEVKANYAKIITSMSKWH